MAIAVRKRALQIETVYHEGGPAPARPLRLASATAVVGNPFAGRYEANLIPFMGELRSLGLELANELIAVLGKDRIEAYGKGAIVGVNGEIEHGAIWHEAGGWALREALGQPKAIVPAAKAVASAGFCLMVPVHYIHAAYVRSHFNTVAVGLQDAPRPDEILFAVVVADGGRIHSRLGGLTKEQVSVGDGQR